MARRTQHARGMCPFCGKLNVVMTIEVRREGGVTAKWGTHGGMHADPKTGKTLNCSGSGKKIENRKIPPMSAWY